jgi:hypothetical protein
MKKERDILQRTVGEIRLDETTGVFSRYIVLFKFPEAAAMNICTDRPAPQHRG